MNRREFAIGVVGLASSRGLNLDRGARPQSHDDRLPSKVAGIRLVDSAVANSATELARAVSPPFLFNHAIRTFVFGSLVGRALGLRFDEEILYLACVLHDLGLTERFQGDLPFEIQGAQAAKQFLEQQGFASPKTAIVWDGIAMHASMIGHFKQPEVRLVGEGAGADVVGPDASQIGRTDVDTVVKAFPRLGFKTSFLNTCADVVRRHPTGASRSFMRDIGERRVAGFHPRNFCDYVISAPFAE